MIKKGNSYFVLYTKDLDKTEEFYKNFGAEITEKDHRKLVLTIGDFEMHFNTDEPIAEYAYILNDISKSRGMIFGLEVENVDEWYSKLQTMNAEIMSPITKTPWNTREFLVTDPNGYHIVFWQEI